VASAAVVEPLEVLEQGVGELDLDLCLVECSFRGEPAVGVAFAVANQEQPAEVGLASILPGSVVVGWVRAHLQDFLTISS
jgi:hypothetical protein